MRVFFDLEFTGLHQNTTPVSIGIIAEDGRTFYGEFTDYDKTQLNEWLTDNVISHLELDESHENPYVYDFGSVTDWKVKGDTKVIRYAIERWFGTYESTVEMWSDCLAYDWMLFCQLFDGAMNIPKKIYYIPFDLCTLLKIYGIDPDVNREDYVQGYLRDDGKKHHSLHDARVIKAIYELVHR